MSILILLIEEYFIVGSQLLNTTLGVKELVANEFAKLEEEVIIPYKRLFPFDVTLNDFFWAFGILRSRAFTHLEGQSLVLIPLADLVNSIFSLFYII